MPPSSEPPQPRTLPDADSHTPAVDHACGIARLMGDGALFARVLARFRSDYRQAAAAIRAALAGGDMPLALRLVHTLKGAAGMIEAVPLRRQAHTLEQSLRSPGRRGVDDAWQRLAHLERELERVLLVLDALPAPQARPTAAIQAAAVNARQEDADAVQRLAALLDDGNGDAVELVRDAAGALTAQLGAQGYGRLADLIEAYDFDGALALLKRAS
jgi:HPt (histidine-containing phosphotransfer) domain-containing protein